MDGLTDLILLDKSGSAINFSKYTDEKVILNFLPYVDSLYTERQMAIFDDLNDSGFTLLHVTSDPAYKNAKFDCLHDKNAEFANTFGLKGVLNMCKRAIVVLGAEGSKIIKFSSFDAMGEELYELITPKDLFSDDTAIKGSV